MGRSGRDDRQGRCERRHPVDSGQSCGPEERALLATPQRGEAEGSGQWITPQ